MKALTITLMLVASLTFAHETSYQEKKKMYDEITAQYEAGNITLETAQKMWKTYIDCCRKKD